MSAAARIVGRMQMNMTDDRSRNLSESQPENSTKTTPIAPLGIDMMRACCDEYPNVVNKMLLKLLMPPFGIDDSIVLRQTNQTRGSFNAAET